MRQGLFGLLVLLLASVPLGAQRAPGANWSFEQGGDGDEIRGFHSFVPGVAGTGLRFDGQTTTVIRKAASMGRLGPAFWVEAWVAIQEYPWTWCAIANQERGHKAGYFFGIDGDQRGPDGRQADPFLLREDPRKHRRARRRAVALHAGDGGLRDRPHRSADRVGRLGRGVLHRVPGWHVGQEDRSLVVQPAGGAGQGARHEWIPPVPRGDHHQPAGHPAPATSSAGGDSHDLASGTSSASVLRGGRGSHRQVQATAMRMTQHKIAKSESLCIV